MRVDCSWSFPGLPAEPCRPGLGLRRQILGICNPTARGRFQESGWKGSHSIEELTAVIFLYLTPLFDLCFMRYAGRKTNDDTAEVRGRMPLE